MYEKQNHDEAERIRVELASWRLSDPILCPDCGRPITLNPSGWWSHDGLPNGCWRLSLDGPNVN